MDNDTKLVMLMETLGDGCDPEVARSVLEAMDWNLEAAIGALVGGAEQERAPARPPPRDTQIDEDGVRAPMMTGYTDTLLANPAEQAALERQRREEERQREEAEAVERAAAEQRRKEANEDQAKEARIRAERDAHERRRRQRQAEVDRLRLEADPEAMRREEERREAEAEEARKRQRQEEERRQREEAKSEAEAKARKQEADLQAKRREEKEQEDLLREKAEAEARAREAEMPPLAKQQSSAKDADEVVQALVTLRKQYKDSDPAGLATCLQTLRKYIDNLARNPTEVKFQRINCENNVFQTRVAAFDGALAVLRAVGFKDGDSSQLAVRPDFAQTKGSSLWDVLTKIDVMLDSLAKTAAS